jgi:hypothetical protein
MKPLDQIRQNAIVRIMKRLKVAENGCLEWQGHLDKWGYGQISVREKHHSVHRLLWTLINGELDRHTLVCHKCDNRKCANLNHLFTGSYKDNMQDMIRKRRNFESSKTHCLRGHPFIGDNLYKTKDGRRQCRACYRYHYYKRTNQLHKYDEALKGPVNE